MATVPGAVTYAWRTRSSSQTALESQIEQNRRPLPLSAGGGPPIAQRDWPVPPKNAGRRQELYWWSDPWQPLPLFGGGNPPLRQLDWPNPYRQRQTADLLTWATTRTPPAVVNLPVGEQIFDLPSRMPNSAAQLDLSWVQQLLAEPLVQQALIAFAPAWEIPGQRASRDGTWSQSLALINTPVAATLPPGEQITDLPPKGRPYAQAYDQDNPLIALSTQGQMPVTSSWDVPARKGAAALLTWLQPGILSAPAAQFPPGEQLFDLPPPRKSYDLTWSQNLQQTTLVTQVLMAGAALWEAPQAKRWASYEWQQNLLATTLGVPVVFPVGEQFFEPLPPHAKWQDTTWTQNLLEATLFSPPVPPPFLQMDWPNPPQLKWPWGAINDTNNQVNNIPPFVPPPPPVTPAGQSFYNYIGGSGGGSYEENRAIKEHTRKLTERMEETMRKTLRRLQGLPEQPVERIPSDPPPPTDVELAPFDWLLLDDQTVQAFTVTPGAEAQPIALADPREQEDADLMAHDDAVLRFALDTLMTQFDVIDDMVIEYIADELGVSMEELGAMIELEVEKPTRH